jgi:hypothetical protein
MHGGVKTSPELAPARRALASYVVRWFAAAAVVAWLALMLLD